MSTLAKKSGPIGARALAIITSLLVALSGLLVVPAAQAADGPSITVSPAENLDPSVENVLTVTGTGFVGDGAALGAYVLVGPESVWQGGGPLVSEGWLDQAYVPARAMASGSFTTTVKIPANTLDPSVNYHVATSAAHQLSGRDRTMDSFSRITVAQPVVEPTGTSTTLSASAASVEVGATVTLNASVAPADAAGTVTFAANGSQLGEPQVVTAGGASLVTPALTVGNQSFTASFAPADPAVFNGSVSAEAVVAVVDKPTTTPESPKAKVSASVSAASKTGLTVAVAADEIVMRAGDATPSGRPDGGAYIGIIDKKLVENYKTDASAGVFEDFIPAAAIRGGKVARTIEIPAADLQRGTEYVAVMWRAHGFLDDDRFLGQADIAVTPAQWDAVFGASQARVSASVTDASAEGLRVSATIENIVLRAAADVPDTGKDDQGVYVGIIEKDRVKEYGSSADAGAAEDFAYKMFIKDGKVTRDIKVSAAKLDRSKEYVAVSWRAHGLLNDSRYLGQADLAVTPAQWDAVFGVEPQVKATVSAASAEGLQVSATVENIVLRAAADVPDTGKDDQGVYVGIIEKDRVNEYGSRADAGAAEGFAYKMFIKDGTASLDLKAPAAKLDRTKEYVAVSWRAHGLLNDSRYLGQADLAVTPAQWDAVFGASQARVSASVTDASAEGLRVSATIENIVLRAAADVPDTGKDDQGVYVGIIEKDRVKEYGSSADAGAAEDFAYKMFIKDGKVTRDIKVSAAKLDRSKEYVAVSWRAHGLLNDSRYLGQADLAVTPAQWDAVFGPKPSISATVTAASAEGLRVSATIENIVLRAAADVPDTGKDDQGVYVGIIEKDRVNEYATDAAAGAAQDFAYKMFIKDGKVTRDISVPAEKLDRTKEYVAVSWLAHGMMIDSRYLGQANLAVTPAQWDAVFGQLPKVTASVTDASAEGLRVSATIENIVLRAAADVPDTGKDDQGVYVGIIEKDRVKEYSSSADAGAAEDFAYKMFIKDGKVTRELKVPAAKLDRSKEYVAVSWLAHGLLNDSRYLGQADLAVASAQWDAVFGGVVVTPGDGDLQWGIFGRFVNYIENIAGGKVQVLGAASRSGNTFVFPQIKGGDWNPEGQTGTVPYGGGVSFEAHEGALQLSILDPKIKVTGPKSAVMTAKVNGKVQPLVDIDLSKATKTTGKNGEVTWKKATAKLRAESVLAFQNYPAGEKFDDVSFTVGAGKDGGTTTPVPPTKPVVKPKPKPQPKPVGTSSSQQAGSLSWGISSGFKGYVTGRIAKGAISTSGVGSSGGAYMFPQADGGSWNAKAQTGSVQFSGVVTFTGHKGLLTETFANPVITITGPTSGTISAGGRSFGLNLGAASKTVGAGGEVTWSGVPVNGSISGGGNTGGGASGGGSFAVDPLSFTVGAPSSAQFGSTTQTEQKAARVAAATPPATTGIRVITPADELVPGGEIEFAAPGFEVDERDILVVLYSDPIVLDDKAGANSFGEVRWIGTLPEDLEPGEHTITLQGSTDAGAVIKVVEKTKKKAKPVIEQGTVEASAQPQQAAAAIADPTSGPVWMWWVGAGALIALAGAMGALVVNQRRNSANATVDTSSTR